MITPVIHNLGQIKFGTKYTFEYLVTNTYDVPLTIDKIVAGCSSCTKVSMDNYIVQPSSTETIHVIFTPGYLGPQTKTITIIAFVAGTLLPQSKVKFKSVVHE